MKYRKTQYVITFGAKNRLKRAGRKRKLHRASRARPPACFLLLIILILCFGGCAEERSAERYLTYRNSSFSVMLTGNRNGLELACRAELENGQVQSISYDAPDALRGLTLRRAENGGWTADFCGTKYRVEDESTLSGLLEPAALLLLEGATVESVRKLSEGVLLTAVCPSIPSPVTVTLSQNGYPTVLSCDSLSLRAECAPCK